MTCLKVSYLNCDLKDNKELLNLLSINNSHLRGQRKFCVASRLLKGAKKDKYCKKVCIRNLNCQRWCEVPLQGKQFLWSHRMVSIGFGLIWQKCRIYSAGTKDRIECRSFGARWLEAEGGYLASLKQHEVGEKYMNLRHKSEPIYWIWNKKGPEFMQLVEIWVQSKELTLKEDESQIM